MAWHMPSNDPSAVHLRLCLICLPQGALPLLFIQNCTPHNCTPHTYFYRLTTLMERAMCLVRTAHTPPRTHARATLNALVAACLTRNSISGTGLVATAGAPTGARMACLGSACTTTTWGSWTPVAGLPPQWKRRLNPQPPRTAPCRPRGLSPWTPQWSRAPTTATITAACSAQKAGLHSVQLLSRIALFGCGIHLIMSCIALQLQQVQCLKQLKKHCKA